MTAALVAFPSNVAQAPSHNGRYVIINTNHDQVPNHVLWIKDRRTSSKRQLMTYNRHVEVGWSPNSQHFFVNDYAESNEADCIIFDTKARRMFRVSALLNDRFRAWGIAKAGHRYAKCTAWQQNNLAVVVTAYGTDTPGSLEKRIILNPQTRRVLSVR